MDSADYVPKNILITGGAGFIGSHVVLRLANKYPTYKVRRPVDMLLRVSEESAHAGPHREARLHSARTMFIPLP